MSYQRPSLISLFSGAGCFDIGFEVAGFKLLAAIDSDSDCCKTIEMNRKGRVSVINSPLEDVNTTLLQKMLGLKKRELEILVGGPPCQPFSKCANGSVGAPLGFEDERSETIHDFFRAVETFLPKAFVIENVPQLISGKNEYVKNLIKRKIYRINTKNKTNYKVSFCKINTANYGVPQLRERIFIIGSRDGLEFQMPSIRFIEKDSADDIIQPFRTCWDAIGHLSRLKNAHAGLKVNGKWGHLLPSIPPGNN
jgi:DNA (cytosine-5)-methyltransferase 1